MLEDADLIEIGVKKSEHRSIILSSIKDLVCLLPKPGSPQPPSVRKWLHSIRLDQYYTNFHKNLYLDMDKVKRIWEVELTTVLEVTNLGHKKRILASLGDAPRYYQPPPIYQNLDINADLNKLVSARPNPL